MFENTKYSVQYQTILAIVKNHGKEKGLVFREVREKTKRFKCFDTTTQGNIHNRLMFLCKKGWIKQKGKGRRVYIAT